MYIANSILKRPKYLLFVIDVQVIASEKLPLNCGDSAAVESPPDTPSARRESTIRLTLLPVPPVPPAVDQSW